jgi:cob(I)alamin adenosyltransferase
MKIYTRKGDKGQTSLFGGTTVKKSSARINAYGTVDELNSVLGLAAAHSPSEKGLQILTDLQTRLFVLGSDLATLQTKSAKIDRISGKEIEEMEQTIDELENTLPPLTNFILPGGTPAGATLHLARTVCRRAERLTVALAEEEPVNEHCITYLNRLSDLLFVLARFENHQAGAEETPWTPRK